MNLNIVYYCKDKRGQTGPRNLKTILHKTHMSKFKLEDDLFFDRLEKSQRAILEGMLERVIRRTLSEAGVLSKTIDFAAVKKLYPFSVAQRALKSPLIDWKRKGTGGRATGYYCDREQFMNLINTL